MPSLIIAVISGLSFSLAFKLNQLLDSHFAYATGISLLFLPAGVKLLCVMAGRLPALLGLTVMAAYAAIGEWSDRPLWSPISFAIVAHVNYYIAILAAMHFMRVRRDLMNLRYWHIVCIRPVNTS